MSYFFKRNLDIERRNISNYIKIRISNSNLLIEQAGYKIIELENKMCHRSESAVEGKFHLALFTKCTQTTREHVLFQ